VFVSCPETSLLDFKTFNIHVVTPHEFFMALEPDLFPWESRVITDFNELLPILSQQPPCTVEESKYSCEESALALV
jgi:diphthamide synthase subunit DPH2